MMNSGDVRTADARPSEQKCAPAQYRRVEQLSDLTDTRRRNRNCRRRFMSLCRVFTRTATPPSDRLSLLAARVLPPRLQRRAAISLLRRRTREDPGLAPQTADSRRTG